MVYTKDGLPLLVLRHSFGTCHGDDDRGRFWFLMENYNVRSEKCSSCECLGSCLSSLSTVVSCFSVTIMSSVRRRLASKKIDSPTSLNGTYLYDTFSAWFQNLSFWELYACMPPCWPLHSSLVTKKSNEVEFSLCCSLELLLFYSSIWCAGEELPEPRSTYSSRIWPRFW